MTTADFKTAARRIECEEDGLYFTRYFFKQRTGSRMIVAPHHQVIQRTLDRVIDGDIRRLIINVPPGYTKTELATINMMGRGLALNRRARFMHLSYSHNLALLNSSTTRSIVKSAAFQSMWPMALRDDADSKAMWWTEYGGGVYASSAAGQVTGFRAGHMEPGWQGCLILDDPVKPDDAYSETMRVGVNARFNETIRSRLAIETTPIVVIMQRIHYHDLSGYLLRGGSGEQWHHLNLPVLIDNSEQYSLVYPENLHAMAALDTVKNLEDKTLVDAGEVEKVRTEAVRALEEKYAPIVKERDDLSQKLTAEKIGGSFARSKFIAEKMSIPADLVEARFGSNFQVVGDAVTAFDRDGNKIFSAARPGEAAGFDEALSILVEHYATTRTITAPEVTQFVVTLNGHQTTR